MVQGEGYIALLFKSRNTVQKGIWKRLFKNPFKGECKIYYHN